MTAAVPEPVPEPASEGWQRLDRRTIAAAALLALGAGVVAGVPTTVGVAADTGIGVALAWVLPCLVAFVGIAAAAEAVRWRAHRYRITDERLELRFDLVVHTRRTIRRNRIRTVDVTANPLYRVFGLAELTAGSGAGAGRSDRVRLAPLHRAHADHLRQELLRRNESPAQSRDGDGPLATLDRRWLRYAPMSFVTPALGLAAFGALLQLADWFGLRENVIDRALELAGRLPLVVTVLVVLAAVAVIGIAGSLGLFVEMWAGYRLEREPGGTLRVRRGLLTTRSMSVEESRLRGVELVEPLGNRLSGAARVDAVAVGIRADDDTEKTDYGTLLPAAPRAVAEEVAAAVLALPLHAASPLHVASPPHAAPPGHVAPPLHAAQPGHAAPPGHVAPLHVALRGHPRAARDKRLLRAVLAALVAPAVLAVLGGLLGVVLLAHLAWISAVVLVPVAVALALDAYRGLGHALTDEHLVVRAGSVRRSTVVLRRTGIIGWTAEQSAFQRRSGLITLTAVTAAGRGGYRVRDIGEDDGIALLHAADPELIDQFTDGRLLVALHPTA